MTRKRSYVRRRAKRSKSRHRKLKVTRRTTKVPRKKSVRRKRVISKQRGGVKPLLRAEEFEEDVSVKILINSLSDPEKIKTEILGHVFGAEPEPEPRPFRLKLYGDLRGWMVGGTPSYSWERGERGAAADFDFGAAADRRIEFAKRLDMPRKYLSVAEAQMEALKHKSHDDPELREAWIIMINIMNQYFEDIALCVYDFVIFSNDDSNIYVSTGVGGHSSISWPSEEVAGEPAKDNYNEQQEKRKAADRKIHAAGIHRRDRRRRIKYTGGFNEEDVVLYAGELYITGDGMVLGWNNRSGHFPTVGINPNVPTSEEITQLQLDYYEAKLNLDRAIITKKLSDRKMPINRFLDRVVVD